MLTRCNKINATAWSKPLEVTLTVLSIAGRRPGSLIGSGAAGGLLAIAIVQTLKLQTNKNKTSFY